MTLFNLGLFVVPGQRGGVDKVRLGGGMCKVRLLVNSESTEAMTTTVGGYRVRPNVFPVRPAT